MLTELCRTIYTLVKHSAQYIFWRSVHSVHSTSTQYSALQCSQNGAKCVSKVRDNCPSVFFCNQISLIINHSFSEPNQTKRACHSNLTRPYSDVQGTKSCTRPEKVGTLPVYIDFEHSCQDIYIVFSKAQKYDQCILD